MSVSNDLYKKGFILTAEALISLVVFFSIFGVVSLVFVSQNDFLYGFIFLSDTFEVIEKGYHDDLNLFINSGTLTPRLSSMAELILAKTGKKVFLSHNGFITQRDCEKGLRLTRIFTSRKLSEVQIKGHAVVVGFCE